MPMAGCHKPRGKYIVTGGDFRRWYGNNDYVVNFENNGMELFSNVKEEKRHVQNLSSELRFKQHLTWTLLSSSGTGFRFRPNGSLYDMNGMSFFPADDKMSYILGFCNSKVMFELLKITAPTLAFQLGDVAKNPLIYDKSKKDKLKLLSRDASPSPELTGMLLKPLGISSGIRLSRDGFHKT